ncbi:MAG TPA: CDP-archaeol synthase [Prolixibacteraceae bacterium]|nr:CDP-archaeol synthase [Prolixibacteraceae bacterium]
MKNFTKRTLTGIIYMTLMLGGTMIHPIVFAVVFAVFLFFVQLEFYNLVENGGYCPHKRVGLSLGILLFLVSFGVVYKILPVTYSLVFIPFTTLIFLFEILRVDSQVLRNATITLAGFIYVAVPFGLLNFIVFSGFPEQPVFYPSTLAGIFFIVWAYDSMAYLVGSKFGKHKIHVKISPKKSWEGFIAGTVAGLIMGIANAVLFQRLSVSSWLAIAAIIILFGTLGDLFESKIKRELKLKDSGTIMPGHGGLLDRVDSLLFALPFIFIWLFISGNI